MNIHSFTMPLALLGALLLTACQAPVTSQPENGSLTISFADSVSRTVLPAVDMNVATYDVVGAGPSGAAFSQTVTVGANLLLKKLVPGSWVVTVTAKNIHGVEIGEGSSPAEVYDNSAGRVSITVKPYEGIGTFVIYATWPDGSILTPQPVAQLIPTSGTARDLEFYTNAANSNASSATWDVSTGYHTMVFQLFDDGLLTAGAVEVVRIAKGHPTSAYLDFESINRATGILRVNVTAEMADPLTVELTGGVATKSTNETVTLSAAVTNFDENVTYVWYVNGEARGFGTTFIADSSWDAGYYRIDVTAFSADGSRAGSTHTNLQIVAAN